MHLHERDILNNSSQMLAHVKQNENGEWVIHALSEHLMEVARISGEFAKDIGTDWAYVTGLWHDLGKYRPAFQKYISSVSGFDPEAHIEQGQGRVDHSTTGAVHAVNEFKTAGRILAYLIAGHHAGLPDWNTTDTGNAALSARIEKSKRENHLEEAFRNGVPEATRQHKEPNTKPLGGRDGLHLWVRMLFSCLVDADFLDTEFFMSPENVKKRKAWPSLIDLKNSFDSYMDSKVKNATDSQVNRIRARVLENCRLGGEQVPGIFTLTVPTGGGKTLSSMAFALEHVLKYNKQRVIVAIPYTSIIEQTADQYREVFGDDAVLEHHSNFDSDQENAKSRLASENWDAPIIVTTNVQLLESLFAAKTSRCRKLHNLVNSVIIMDEAQLLPPDFLQPVLDVLRLLTEHYGVTLILSTATQPALASRQDAFGKKIFRGLDAMREIIPNVTEIFEALERVCIEKPKDMISSLSWENLAEELKQCSSVLAIVNTRRDCRILFDLMPKGTIHLSGLMCARHRSRVIADIKERLSSGSPVRVISTQLVEAGVDLDFPVVYRALTGLDSIAQAAGRCNREGKQEKGRVVVFIPPQKSPRGMLLLAEQATRSVWHEQDASISRELYSRYFQQYFSSVDTDRHKIKSLLSSDTDHCIIQFRTAAEKFKLIDDKGTWQILVPFDEDGEKYLNIMKANGPERYLMRKLQRYSVTVYEHEFKKLKSIGAIQEIHLGIWTVCITNGYDVDRGLLIAEDLFSADPATMVL